MEKILFLGFFLVAFLSASASANANICITVCDGDDSYLATQTRNATTVNVSNRIITVVVDDRLDAAYARLDNGEVGDNLYIERSFDGGVTFQECGLRQVGRDETSVKTPLFNLDDPKTGISGMGALRGCARARVTGVNLCTQFVRSTFLSESLHDAAATGLMQFYQDDGKFKTIGWWNNANAVTAMLGYIHLAGGIAYSAIMDDAYEKNKEAWWGNYNSDALDDIMWWTLAWLDAYEMSGRTRYLDTAIDNANLISEYRDDKCGDGVWWNIYSTYKNAITNELFVKTLAKLANQMPTEEGRAKYRQEAIEMWDWFVYRSKMVNSDWLINDGLNGNCENNGDKTYTYNQGVILGAAAELYKATNDTKYLTDARKIADAVIASAILSPNGILREICEIDANGCSGGNNNSFKGVFIRNLGELNRVLPGRPYQGYLERQVESNIQNNRNQNNQYGYHWAGPFDKIDAARQHSVLDAFNALL